MDLQVDCAPGLALGMGVDIATGASKLIGMANVPAELPGSTTSPSNSAEEALTITFATSKEELATSLHVQASASASYGIFSASGSLDIFNSLDYSSYGVWLTVVGKVVTGTSSYNQPTLTDPAVALLQNPAGAGPFSASYGHGYVREIEKGASVTMVFQWLTTSETEQRNLHTSISVAAQGAFSASASVDVQQNFKRTLSNTRAQVYYVSKGGKVIPGQLDAVAAFDAVNTFLLSVSAANSVALSATITDYDAVARAALKDKTLPQPTPWALGTTLLHNCAALQQEIDATDTLLGQYRDAKEHPERYNGTATALAAIADPAIATLKTYRAAAVQGLKTYKDNISTSDAPQNFPVTVTPLPSLPALTLRNASGDYLGNGSIYFYIQNLGNVIAPQKADGTGALILKPLDPNDVTQRWILRQDGLYSFFLNGASKQYLAMPTNFSAINNQLVQTTDSSSGNAKWVLGSSVGVPGYIGWSGAAGWVISFTQAGTVGLGTWAALTNQIWAVVKVDPNATPA
ncbi:hypothetical protein [Nitrospirillum sp. BR 11163]|uniref:RICIN domain-containing protein n=1 Tax=Nitrospirillum sp. BR 11163 TaxID=3104323 RepID=UPI002AFF5F09|nr:hypothetical protein [Nitrospirillum sp. BR 11163]MEA1673059.1 hypothetical protein [Nitrospirillum sp. BR 11163]